MLRLLLFSISLFTLQLDAQSVTGTFPALAGQIIRLIGFDGLGKYTIDSVKVLENGYFEMQYATKDFGIGYLASDNNKSFIVIMAPDENLMLENEAEIFPQGVLINSGRQNKLFEQYANEHPRREQALSAWAYLEKIYTMDPLFAIHETPKKAIQEEQNRIIEEDRAFLESLEPGTYVSWYLPFRKLVSSVPVVAQYRTGEILETIEAFRSIDYTDSRLHKSGLLGETLQAHFWLIENSGRTLDSVYIEMNRSIDLLVENLLNDQRKFNEITGFLFNLLEQRSLFGSSEYLALKILNEQSCTIDKDIEAQLENYRAMKIGNTAPDFVFGVDFFSPGDEPGTTPGKLSELKTRNTLVLFGASWCPMCTEEFGKITKVYKKWKNRGLEVIYVSLDENKQEFQKQAASFPFISLCDGLKWESPVIKAWHVFATPTFYLLDENHKIILKPRSVEQVDAWVEFKML